MIRAPRVSQWVCKLRPPRSHLLPQNRSSCVCFSARLADAPEHGGEPCVLARAEVATEGCAQRGDVDGVRLAELFAAGGRRGDDRGPAGGAIDAALDEA